MERKPFEIIVGETELALELGRLVCTLFRTKQEVDYFAVHLEDDTTLRVFNNQELVRWLAGYEVIEQDDVINRPVKRIQGLTFREEYGWTPAVVEKEAPSDDEEEWFLDVNVRDLDEEWRELE